MILSLSQIEKVVESLKNKMPKDKIILLNGTLASGKTTLVKEFARTLGITQTSSPTFSILNNYDNKIYHYDLYNDGVEKFLELGLLETLDEDVFHFIEWSDKRFENLLKTYGYEFLKVDIEVNSDSKREYKLS